MSQHERWTFLEACHTWGGVLLETRLRACMDYMSQAYMTTEGEPCESC